MGVGIRRLRWPDNVGAGVHARAFQKNNSRQNALVFLVRTFEIGELVVRFEMPNPGSNFVDQIMIVRH